VRKSNSLLKNLLFSLTVIAALLGLTEGLLRLTGQFTIPPLVIPAESSQGVDWVQINPGVATRFFSGSVKGRHIQMPTIFADRFTRVKPDNEFRIFVLGGSSVQGYPYPYNVAFPALLEIILNNMLAGKTCTVMNCGVTALNSYALIEFTDELLDYDPDLLVVYSGHNEFYGVFGSGSALSFSRNRRVTRCIMHLQKQALYQAFRTVITRLRGENNQTGPETGLIEVMAREQSIPSDSETVKATLQTYEENLGDICDRAAASLVPVMLCTVVSNREGLSPMHAIAQHPDKSLEKLVNTGLTHLATRNGHDLLETGKQLIDRDPDYAWGYYLLGKAQLLLNETSSGCDNLVRASDLDGLRFRAHSGQEKIIMRMGSAPNDPVESVDLRQVFAEASGHGCPGYDLFVDHVHPTAYGHFLIATEIAQSICVSENFKQHTFSSEMLSWDDCKDQAGYTDIEEMLTLMQIVSLYRSYPLQTLPEARSRISDIMKQIQKIHRNLPDVLRKTYERWVRERGQFDIHYEAGQIYLETGDCIAAIREFEIALKAHPDFQVVNDRLKQARIQCE
jgi:tetratricopeptide (TPR) repeat protein